MTRRARPCSRSRTSRLPASRSAPPCGATTVSTGTSAGRAWRARTSPGWSPCSSRPIPCSLRKALDELSKTPPARQAAMGAIEGALGDLQAAAAEGHLDATQRTRLLDRVTGAARQLAVDAIKEATGRGGAQAKIAEANQALAEGDALRGAGSFKAAVNKYKDALAKAEGA